MSRAQPWCWLTFIARHSKSMEFGSRNVTYVRSETPEQTAFSEVSFLLTLSLADPAASFRGGGQLWAGSQPRVPPKNENSTDLTHYFLGWTQIQFRRKNIIKNKSFLRAFGGGPNGMMAPFLGFGGHGRVTPPPPGSASRRYRGFQVIFWIENDRKCTVNEPTVVLVLHNLLNCLYLHLLLNFTSPKRARCSDIRHLHL